MTYEQEQKQRQRNQHPCLVLGVGGTGAGVVRRVKKLVADRIDDYVPTEVLVIDFDHEVAAGYSEEDGRLANLDNDELLYLDPRDIQDALRNFERVDEDGPVWQPILSWFPDRARVRIPYSEVEANGAGQLRPLGRVGLFLNDVRIDQRLRSKLNRLREQAKQRDMKEPRVVIVCSLSGGTGAGCFVDLAYLLRREEGKPRVYLYLLLPEVFQEVDVGGRLLPNAYAALREVSLLKDQAIDFEANYLHIPSIRVDRGNEEPFAKVFLFRHAAYHGSEGIRLVSSEMADAIAAQLNPAIQTRVLATVSNGQVQDLRPGQVGRRSACFSTARAVELELENGGTIAENIYDELIQRLAGTSGYPLDIAATEARIATALNVDLTPEERSAMRSEETDTTRRYRVDRSIAKAIEGIIRSWVDRLLQGADRRASNAAQLSDHAQAMAELRRQQKRLTNLIATTFSDDPNAANAILNDTAAKRALNEFLDANRFRDRISKCFQALESVIDVNDLSTPAVTAREIEAVNLLLEEKQKQLTELRPKLEELRPPRAWGFLAELTGLGFFRRWLRDGFRSGALRAAADNATSVQEQWLSKCLDRSDFQEFLRASLTVEGCNHLLTKLQERLTRATDGRSFWKRLPRRLGDSYSHSARPRSSKGELIAAFVVKFYPELLAMVRKVEGTGDPDTIISQVDEFLNRQRTPSSEWVSLTGRVLRFRMDSGGAAEQLKTLIQRGRTNVFSQTTPDDRNRCEITLVAYPAGLDWEGGEDQFKRVAESTAQEVLPGTFDPMKHNGTTIIVYHESLYHPLEHVLKIDEYLDSYESQPYKELFHIDARWASSAEFKEEVAKLRKVSWVLCGNADCFYDLTAVPRTQTICPGCDRPIRSRCGNQRCMQSYLHKNERHRLDRTCPDCGGFNHAAWWCCDRHDNVPVEIPIDKEHCPKCIEEFHRDPTRHPFSNISRRPDLKDRVTCPSCEEKASKDPNWNMFRIPRELLSFFRTGVNGHDRDHFERIADKYKLPEKFRCPQCRAFLIPVHHAAMEVEC